jgi:hypothetical protein
MSITIARNAWVGYSICLCYGGQELHRAMDGRGSDCIKKGLRNRQRKVSIKGGMKEKEGGSFWYEISYCCIFQTTRLVIDELHYANNLAE